MSLVTRDPITGLRRNGIRYRDGNPPVPFGCRWCGIEDRHHGRRWVPGHGWHKWEQPTSRQILARMKARRLNRPTRQDPHAGCFEPHQGPNGPADCNGNPL